MQEFEKIYFTFLGMDLQEPLSLMLNWIIASICFTTFYQLKKNPNSKNLYFQLFFLSLGISTFFGGLGHLFFKYWGLYGKFPSWSFALIANLFSAFSIVHLLRKETMKAAYKKLAIAKFLLFMILTFIFQKFLFVSIDAIITYLLYCLYLANIARKEGEKSMIYFVRGICILLPSAFIFLMNINISIWFNRDDFSHVLMIISILLFSKGARELKAAKA